MKTAKKVEVDEGNYYLTALEVLVGNLGSKMHDRNSEVWKKDRMQLALENCQGFAGVGVLGDREYVICSAIYSQEDDPQERKMPGLVFDALRRPSQVRISTTYE